nr:mycofactocin system FadH/OYE family oxidoreductase 2 [Rhodococcus fascians]
MNRYPRLFTPLELGPRTARNRVVFTAHLTNFAVDGLPTARHAAYYEARARGGAGLIIIEEQCTHPSDRPYEKLIRGYLPEVIPGYQEIADGVHRHGGLVLAQLNNNGGQSSSMYTRTPVLAPSAVADPLFREVPRTLGLDDIREIVEGFALVADHCRQGGFDGVELQCSQSSVLRGFLARSTNRRQDCYGGDLWRRTRLLREVIDAVRGALGVDLVLGVRLAGSESVRGGIELDEAIETATIIEATGAVDYINTTVGVVGSTMHLIEASMATAPGYANFVPAAVRAHVSLPVVGVGRFADPAQAESALIEGVCDLVGIARGQIADPDFVAKAAAGEASTIRPCVACNQDCIGRVGMNRSIGCVVNPYVGNETLLSAPTVRGLNVLVVGGGPAGLQAASSAAQRGHRVTLYESRSRVGGQVLTASVAPHRAEFGGVITALESECRRFGVTMQTGTTVTAQDILAAAPDHVVVATGARPVRPSWAGELERIVDVRDVLDGRCRPEGRVLVFDELGFHQGTSTAEFLAGLGCEVTIATPGMVVGQDLGLTLDLVGWRRRAHAASIACITDVIPLYATAHGDAIVTSLLHHPTGRPRAVEADWIVCALHQEPVDELWKELQHNGVRIDRIGDALTPRRADSAVGDGSRCVEQMAAWRTPSPDCQGLLDPPSIPS